MFARGFDTVSGTAVCDRFDEYTMLDLLDSLVRKSLITTTRAGGRTRYAMLETIRQFTEDQHATTGCLGEHRCRHAHHYATQAIARWELWDGPGYDTVTRWMEVEFENLRAGFRWATDQADLTSRNTRPDHRLRHNRGLCIKAAVSAPSTVRAGPCGPALTWCLFGRAGEI